MGFFSDFLIATKSDAKKIIKASNPTKRWPGISWKNLTCLDLVNLHGVMSGVTDLDDVVELDSTFDYWSGMESESVELRQFPDSFTKALSEVGPNDAAKLANSWRADGVTDWEPADVRELLDELCALAKKAVAENKPIVMLISGF